MRVDVPKFGNTAFDNPAADALTFRDQDGSPVRYNSGALPETTPYWSPRVGLNWDVERRSAPRSCAADRACSPASRRTSGSRTRSATPACSTDSPRRTTPTAFPFNPNPDQYKPAPTGGAAASYELDVTDQGFRFPQTWRTNIGVDRRLPWGLDRHASTTSTTATSTRRSTSTPTCRRLNPPTPASTAGRAGSRPPTSPGLRRRPGTVGRPA